MSGPIRKNLVFEAAKLAKMVNGATTCSLGETNVLVTVVTDSAVPSGGFVPLIVDYKQKAAAVGRIPTTHIRRDVGFSEQEILTSRMIDRSIRPAFLKDFNCKTQIVCNQLSLDGHNDADILAINGASASIAISDIPWSGPIGAVRMGLIGDMLVTNPTRREQEESRLGLVISANKKGNVLMIDCTCREPVVMTDINKTIKRGVRECVQVVDSIEKLQKSFGKPKRELPVINTPTNEQLEFMKDIAKERISAIFYHHGHDKQSRDVAMQTVQVDCLEAFKEKFSDSSQSDTLTSQFSSAFLAIKRSAYVNMLRKDSIRCDGRKFDDLRPIDCRIDLYKPLHGSAIFQRGQTQVFCSTTFDSPEAAIRSDPLKLLLSGLKDKNFMLHYEFPPYATNEIGRIGSMPDRREIGHGALAEKALRPLIPEKNDMTIRLNCEVLESNGSSSMASVCAGSLSLMDASVNIKEHVAGVSVGLFMDEEATHEPILLTDILGFEDFIGDMDFKIAGTKRAITAIQLDVKPKTGVPPTILYKAINVAHNARERILAIMNRVIAKPREVKKDNHPVMKTIYIPPYKRAKFIGFGGANLKKLVAQIGVRVTLLDNSEIGAGREMYSSIKGEKTNDEDASAANNDRDNILLFAPNQEAMDEADEFIKSLMEKEYKEPELDFNGIYTATIEEIRPNGVMITLFPDMAPTLLPLSQLDMRKVHHPSALDLSVGQKIQVKYFGRDPATGQMRLSRKSLQMTSVARDHSQVQS